MQDMMEAAILDKKEAFQLKGSLFTLSVLQLYTQDVGAISAQIAQTIAKSPKFFHHAPVVIDLAQIAEDPVLCDFISLASILRSHGLIPVGVRGGSANQHQAAEQAGLAVLAGAKANAVLKPQQKTTLFKESEGMPPKKTKIIRSTIRSGQQIIAEGSDLIIVGTVSNGAEVIADGNIHIYGILRGRALAGTAGDTSAIIFCRHLQAEMVSIAGRYRLHEEAAPIKSQENVCITLADGRICIDLC